MSQFSNAISKEMLIIWQLYIFSFVFHINLPGIGQSTTAVLFPILLLFSFKYQQRIVSSKARNFIIIFTTLVLGLALIAGYKYSVYINFCIWIANAILFMRLASNQDLNSLMIRHFSVLCLVLLFYKLLIIIGLPNLGIMSMQKNGFAFILVILYAIGYVHYREHLPRSKFRLFLIFYWIIILLNGSRSGILSSLLISSYYFFHYEIRLKNNMSFVIKPLIGLGIIALIFPILLSVSEPLNRQFQDTIKITTATNMTDIEENSSVLRLFLLKKGIDLIKKEPLFGVGLDRFMEDHHTIFDLYMKGIRHNEHLFNPHNSFIAILTETGLIAGGLFCIYFLSLIVLIFKKIRPKQDANLILISNGVTIALFIGLMFISNMVSIRSWSLILLPPLLRAHANTAFKNEISILQSA